MRELDNYIPDIVDETNLTLTAVLDFETGQGDVTALLLDL